jgi:hypothetical protein
MQSTPQYAPDVMMRAGGDPERFDDGLVHNHHWAVTANEVYPSQGQGAAIESNHGRAFAVVAGSPFKSHSALTNAHDRHDDGLVHNHDWAVTGK